MRAWIITADYLADKTLPSDVGTCGPRNAPDSAIESLKNGAGFAFELRDDDGNLYYRGRAIWDDNEFEDGAYGPLGDFGMPNAGCTSIRYPGHSEFNC